MEIELQEIFDFISAIPPFDRLPPEVVTAVSRKITIRYLRRGRSLPPLGVEEHRLYLLRKGAVSIHSHRNTLLGKLGEGDVCTAFCLGDAHEPFRVEVEEDTLLYTLSCEEVEVLLQQYPDVLAYFHHTASHRLNLTMMKMEENRSLPSLLLQTPVRDILRAPAVTAPQTVTIREAAIRMSEARVSSLILTADEQPVGIVTDRDITKRCVAQGLSTATAVAEIMTRTISSVSSATDAFEAMMKMTRNHVRHLAVIDDGTLKGMVNVSDLLHLEGRNAVYITNAIRKAESVAALKEQSKTLPQLQWQLVQAGVPAQRITEVMTAVGSAITRRLIQLAEEKLGPPPVAYGWVAAGSHARREQSSHSDQDNALFIGDDLRDEDAPWFEALAKFVSDGLAACGYSYCPGEVMATNPRWRLRRDQWSKLFRKWITTPSPKALMYSSIFFDLRTVYGDKSLLSGVREEILQLTPRSELFLAHLTHNALKLKPPLGFFRDFVLVHDGKHNDTLDLKHNGLAPIVDLARIYALAEGATAVATIERLQEVAGTPSLSMAAAANLEDAFEFIGTLRIHHQAQQIHRGEEADNFMAPSAISKLERAHLKDAFKVIQTLQSYVESRYKVG
ncbi:MAG: cyclic nucleotide-binding/CBS domain-containing protein [Gammaproteobacteria bacterium]|nr:cyclic nucleotide-binding/CBS domain-containing protein [Gammaproteobacteria bacterium]